MAETRPRLRFDKGALRFVADLQVALRDAVPSGTTVVFTIAAPIRLRSKTTAVLEQEIRELLKSRAKQPEIARTINGNRIHVRLVRKSHRPNVMGFVYTPEPGAAEILLDEALRT